MTYEIRIGSRLLETLTWDGPKWTFPEPEDVATRRKEFEAYVLARAYELKGLVYERRSSEWLESFHHSFACREVSETEVAVTTPLGVFRIQARRVKKGDTTSGVVMGRTTIGTGLKAKEDQESLPVELHGRLNPPSLGMAWTFQADHFVYEDGSSSDYFGSYPRDIAWEGEPPEWPR